MSRPRKSRRICSKPSCTEFGPEGRVKEIVTLSLDEFETIRLIDLEEYTQEDCAKQMEVARTTVQAIYAEARKKIADCIVNGYQLRIHGGDVKVCDKRNKACRRHRCCHKEDCS